MKILHLSTSDKIGGAAIAAYRIHNALLENEIDSKMLVMRKVTDESNVNLAKEGIDGKFERHISPRIKKFRDLVELKKYENRKNKILFSAGYQGIDICKNPIIANADILHLHWINSQYISIKTIKELADTKKIVWTLHDMWPFTGGCHYSGDCRRYNKNCGHCPVLETKKEEDLSRNIWQKKSKAFREIDFKLVTPSKWLGKCAASSSLFREKEIITIPNVLNENIFRPFDKNFSREILGLEQEKYYICFGAMNATSNPRKGWRYLKDALISLVKNNSEIFELVELLVFGASDSPDIERLPFKSRLMGRVYDEYTLSLIYNSANLFIAPSLEDNLPNTVLESLHCGTPVVAFDIGGMPDMITHKSNGYLAESRNIDDLGNGIMWCINSLNKRVGIENPEMKKESIISKYLSVYM